MKFSKSLVITLLGDKMQRIVVFIKKILRLVNREFSGLLQIIRCIFRKKNEIIFRSWISIRKGLVEHRNWGDDINKFLFEELTEKKVLVYPTTRLSKLFNISNYVFIGSIVPHLVNKNSIVWGSGVAMPTVINDKQSFVKPKKVLAVRGPLTRQYFIDNGVDCPSIMGDPALLLPLFYKPRIQKKYKVGVIPHFDDLKNNNPVVRKILENNDVYLIKTGLYTDWHDFINEINSCDFIISASLHGIIVSEAYCIPSLWVEFSAHEDLWDYRFQDFYKSIGKNNQKKISIHETFSLEELLKYRDTWKVGQFRYKPLLESCPFYEEMKKHLIYSEPEEIYPIYTNI